MCVSAREMGSRSGMTLSQMRVMVDEKKTWNSRLIELWELDYIYIGSWWEDINASLVGSSLAVQCTESFVFCIPSFLHYILWHQDRNRTIKCPSNFFLLIILKTDHHGRPYLYQIQPNLSGYTMPILWPEKGALGPSDSMMMISTSVSLGLASPESLLLTIWDVFSMYKIQPPKERLSSSRRANFVTLASCPSNLKWLH